MVCGERMSALYDGVDYYFVFLCYFDAVMYDCLSSSRVLSSEALSERGVSLYVGMMHPMGESVASWRPQSA